ncbi:MAG: phage portal protein [bacterium]
MELRNMFKNIFGKTKQQNTISFKLLNSYDNYFYPNSSSYDDATVRTCIDIIAKNAAKLKPKHIIRSDGKTEVINDSLNSLLSARPNEFMTTYDFIYKLVSQLYIYNNAFVYIKSQNGLITGLYIIDYQQLELKESGEELFCSFKFLNDKITVPYTDLIHIRRYFSKSEFFGESENKALSQPLSLLTTVKQALENAVKNCTKLRGYLKIEGIVRPEDQDRMLDDFNEKFVRNNNSTGIAVLDSKADYKELTKDIQTADCQQMNFIREDVYRYFNLSESILNSKFSEEEWNSFYENVIEPLVIQLSQEFTAKLFTEEEKAKGNEVIFVTNKLEYTSLKSKVSMAQVLMQTGIFTVNEFREIFGFESIQDGDSRLVSLNYVKSDKQDKYQIGGEGNE